MRKMSWVVGAGAALLIAVVGVTVVDPESLPTSGIGRPLGDQSGGTQTAPPGPVAPSFAGPGTPRQAAGRVLVAPVAGVDPAAVARVATGMGAAVEGRLPGTRVRDVRLPRGLGVEQAIRRFERRPEVAYAEPDYVLFPSASPVTPNDPGFPQLYGLDNTGQNGGLADSDIDAPEAWATTIGSSSTVVAVIDTGADLSHPDLRDNRWTNPGEVAGNGVDDDANGYVDDVHGWDFVNDDNTVFDGPGDEHGTHVAGTIGATGGNGVGVTGVAWRAQLMALKFIGSDGGLVSDAVAAIDYAVRNGATISNNSWGAGTHSRSLQDAISAAGQGGHLFVAAAGNGGSDQIGDDIDSAPQYPAAYPASNIIAVGATDEADVLASWSNFGASAVDLVAPGVRVLSTLPNNTYGTYSGTSMATPQVTGAAALLLGHDPQLGAAGLKSAILGAVDPVPALQGVVATSGRLNIGNVLGDPSPALTISLSPTTVTLGASAVLSGRATRGTDAVADLALVVEQRRAGRSTWQAVAGGESVTAEDGSFVLTGLAPAAHTEYRVRALDDSGLQSAARRLNVRAVVTNSTSRAGLRLGRSRVVSGRVAPRHGGRVAVTVLRNGRRVVRTAVPLSDSRFRFSYQPRRRGTYTTIVRWAGDAHHLGATSVRRSFKVR